MTYLHEGEVLLRQVSFGNLSTRALQTQTAIGRKDFAC